MVAEYEDTNRFDKLPYSKCAHVKNFVFYKDKLVIVYDHTTKTWQYPGGAIDVPETFEECSRREVKEETNMRILEYKPIGYQKAYQKNKPKKYEYQLRVYCKVKPYGKFVEDPDGEITEIKYINPKDFKKYFDWGKVGDRIIERALEIHNKK
jgi:8-oxo-dGTP pyrophosphatase MutT (NUDIX family)